MISCKQEDEQNLKERTQKYLTESFAKSDELRRNQTSRKDFK